MKQLCLPFSKGEGTKCALMLDLNFNLKIHCNYNNNLFYFLTLQLYFRTGIIRLVSSDGL